MKIFKLGNNMYDFFRPLTVEEKMDSVKHGVHHKSEDSQNGWGKWTRVAINQQKKDVRPIKGAPLTHDEIVSLKKLIFR